jgi:hypothetical protein
MPPQQPPVVAPGLDSSEEDIPSWLKSAAPKSSIFDEAPAQQAAPTPAAAPSDFDTPDWLNAFTPSDAPQVQTPVASPVGSQPDTGSEDSLFTEMPDWLSNAVEAPSSESTSTPAANADTIAPSELPSWVQAMRPVDASASTSLSGDRTIESRGALAGLQGVLPAVQGFAPTSKPKAYSIKLRASEEQQAHAALLEQILAAETSPVPIGSAFVLAPSRILRALLTLFLFVGLTIVILMGMFTFSLPVGLPIETGDALNVIRSIPEGAPVLVVFDYDPARIGEMETAAAPVFDQMMLLRHPRMAFISTSETGAILAERFISGPLAGYNYQNGDQYLNLGYLPSGEMGIRAFVQSPQDTAKYAITGTPPLFSMTNLVTPAWASDSWTGITSLSQFAAFIVITDNAESARAWIEQTTAASGLIPNIPMVVISSAQAAPMIQPYYASKQINGLVNGLYGGALVEQNNVGRPGTARAYWDAYSIGVWLAAVLILGGGLLNLILGLRDRRNAREGK